MENDEDAIMSTKVKLIWHYRLFPALSRTPVINALLNFSTAFRTIALWDDADQPDSRPILCNTGNDCSAGESFITLVFKQFFTGIKYF